MPIDEKVVLTPEYVNRILEGPRFKKGTGPTLGDIIASHNELYKAYEAAKAPDQPVDLPPDVLDILRSYRASCLFNAETNEYGAADGWMESVKKIDAALSNTHPKREDGES